MALTAGSVSVADTGIVTKNGLAEAIFDGFVDNYAADMLILSGKPVQLPNAVSNLPERVMVLRGYGITATRLAVAIVSHITANAAVTVTMPATPAGDGYQRDPAGAFPDCLGPAAPKTLAGTVA